MIIVNIYGGLGNQMFQYALGRSLSQKLNTSLKIDYSINLTRKDFNPDDIPSIFDIFNINVEKATIQEIRKFKASNKYSILKNIYIYIINKYPIFFKTKFKLIKETNSDFNRLIMSLSGNCYLSGYWQSEKYFINIKDLIWENFNIKNPLERDNLEVAKKIENSVSVSIHLRGRDYITKSETNKIHFTCDNSYYERSINYILERVKNPAFFIFSDDPEWAKSFLKINYPCTFVEGNSWNKKSFEDLRLMSLCKHNIIANSSFSWWAAWLNKNPNKIVIAPVKWFNDSSRNSKDIIPNSWIKI